MPNDKDLKRRVRDRLEKIEEVGDEFDRLAELVDQQLSIAAGFTRFESHTQFGQGPDWPPSPQDPPPDTPQLPPGE